MNNDTYKPKDTLIKKNSTVEEAVRLIQDLGYKYRNSDIVLRLITPPIQVTPDYLEAINRKIVSNISYKLDEKGKEQVKSPVRLFHDGKGDCDDFSTLWVAILHHLGVAHSVRIVKYAENGHWAHVYVIAHLDSGDYVLDTVHNQFGGRFGEEPTHTQNKDFITDMDLYALEGTEHNSRCNNVSLSINDVTEEDRLLLLQQLIDIERNFLNNYAEKTGDKEAKGYVQVLDEVLELSNEYEGLGNVFKRIGDWTVKSLQTSLKITLAPAQLLYTIVTGKQTGNQISNFIAGSVLGGLSNISNPAQASSVLNNINPEVALSLVYTLVDASSKAFADNPKAAQKRAMQDVVIDDIATDSGLPKAEIQKHLFNNIVAGFSKSPDDVIVEISEANQDGVNGLGAAPIIPALVKIIPSVISILPSLFSAPKPAQPSPVNFVPAPTDFNKPLKKGFMKTYGWWILGGVGGLGLITTIILLVTRRSRRDRKRTGGRR